MFLFRRAGFVLLGALVAGLATGQAKPPPDVLVFSRATGFRASPSAR